MRKRTPPLEKHADARHEDDRHADSLDDAALFRQAIGPVRELPTPPAPPAAPRPRPAARMAARDEAEARNEFRQAMDVDRLAAGDALGYRREHVAPKLLADLRRGRYAAQDELDLHGLDAGGAEALLRQFLRHAREQGHGCVRVVHGKGLNSPTGVPILKNLVDRVLRQRNEVLAFHSAPVAQGGTGAVLVLLKR
ncbi:MAG: Smr/MutS family protein [Pseudoxanthomonas suwonensis]|nr:Smr/MutS family protein [Pseudoxanthomonas suwonensis]